MNKTDKKRIVVIGGGTGTFVALTGLKYYPLHLSAIITMMDSGGSTGRLRDQLGVLPPGDLRQALVALSQSEKIWRDLFVYRFENGDLSGHNFGNIFISGLEKITGSIEKAIESYKLAIAANPDLGAAYSQLGLIYAEKGDYKNSIKIFKKYLNFSNNPEEEALVKEFINKLNTLVK